MLNWAEGVVVAFGAHYKRKSDNATYTPESGDWTTNTVVMRRMDDRFIRWVGNSQDFKKEFDVIENRVGEE